MEVPVTEARAQFADLVNKVAYTGEPVAITRRGRVMAALVSPEDLELLNSLRAQRYDLTQTEPGNPAGPDQPGEDRRPGGPLRIAAEYRPGPPPSHRPGFGR
ncbi:type II toxin-antitoxin system Phd/YefM family antitoxin [Actinomadura harenae]|uniref:Antitoxin n=1 Tax=Actinomadura harenae TaxID=2483351 RepID=A0A3M2LMB5_9ACTN|nr:type II toxin-antitoxin system Phd/YefM family antitoxin [Actinomadura harenae]RMI38602.1 type II toxin-antitoxin system prevent-host-death family antitoxin [Actinomadura harenae]